MSTPVPPCDRLSPPTQLYGHEGPTRITKMSARCTTRVRARIVKGGIARCREVVCTPCTWRSHRRHSPCPLAVPFAAVGSQLGAKIFHAGVFIVLNPDPHPLARAPRDRAVEVTWSTIHPQGASGRETLPDWLLLETDGHASPIPAGTEVSRPRSCKQYK